MQHLHKARFYHLGESHIPQENVVWKLIKNYFKPDPQETYYAVNIVINNVKVLVLDIYHKTQRIYKYKNITLAANFTPRFICVDLYIGKLF
jgi:hypothetical protein